MVLRDTFKKYGEIFTFVSLSAGYYIYKRDSPTKQEGSPAHYEVVKPVKIGGELHYPGPSQWGIYAWTCIGEKGLVRKMAELMKKDANKQTNNDTSQEVQS